MEAHALSVGSCVSQDSIISQDSPAIDRLTEAFMNAEEAAQKNRSAAAAATELASLAEQYRRLAKEAAAEAKLAATAAYIATQKYQEVKAIEAKEGREDACALVKPQRGSLVAAVLRALGKLAWTPRADFSHSSVASNGIAEVADEAHSSVEGAHTEATCAAVEASLSRRHELSPHAILECQNPALTATEQLPPPALLTVAECGVHETFPIGDIVFPRLRNFGSPAEGRSRTRLPRLGPLHRLISGVRSRDLGRRTSLQNMQLYGRKICSCIKTQDKKESWQMQPLLSATPEKPARRHAKIR